MQIFGNRPLGWSNSIETQCKGTGRHRKFSSHSNSANGSFPTRMTTLNLDHLTKSYDGLTVVDNVCLTINGGDVFGLLGPNGAGKTTAMSMIAGLVTADSGQVLLDNQPFDTSDPQQRRLLGVVPQELAIYPELTAGENLKFFGSLFGFGKRELKERVERALVQVGLADHAKRAARTFSGGMKRRLNFAAGLLHDPRIVILDEPTVGVDPQSRSYLLDVVRSLRDEQRVVIYCSHYMEEVEAVCRRVAIMDHGRVIVCDDIETLLEQVSESAVVEVTSWNPGVEQRLRSEVGNDAVTIVEPTQGVDARATARITPIPVENRRIKIRSSGSQDGGANTDLGRELARVLTILTEEHIPIVRVDTQDASLERLFLELTGRQLRD